MAKSLVKGLSPVLHMSPCRGKRTGEDPSNPFPISPLPTPGWRKQREEGCVLSICEDKLVRKVYCPSLKRQKLGLFYKNVIIGQEVQDVISSGR